MRSGSSFMSLSASQIEAFSSGDTTNAAFKKVAMITIRKCYEYQSSGQPSNKIYVVHTDSLTL